MEGREGRGRWRGVKEFGIEDLPAFRDRVFWREEDGVCVEILGRGLTRDELVALQEMPKGQKVCEWIL